MAYRRVTAHGIARPRRQLLSGQTLLGEPLWRPPAPNGFSDDKAAWIDGLAERAEIASNFAARVADRLDPKALVDEALARWPRRRRARRWDAPAAALRRSLSC